MTKNPAEQGPNQEAYISTGIYRRRVPSPCTAEECEALADRYASPPSAREWCEQYLRDLAEIIRPYVCESGRKRFALNLGEGWEFYSLTDVFESSTVELQVMDAIDCMHTLRTLEGHIGKDDSLVGRMNWIVLKAYQLGKLSERMGIRPFEPEVSARKETRKKNRENGRAGKLSGNQWKLVEKFIRERTRSGLSAAESCRQASAQLLTGKFDGINSSIEISVSALQARWSNRNRA